MFSNEPVAGCQEKETAREVEGVPDEEGWVTVTRYGKSKGVPRTEAHEKRLSKKEKKKRTEKVGDGETTSLICV